MKRITITPATKLIAITVAALVGIAAGTWALFGWPVSALTVGALLWVDLFFAGRELSRPSRPEPEP